MHVILTSVLLALSLNKLAKGITCDLEDIYRTLNGVCNNPDNSYWGSAPRTHQTFLPLKYADGMICPKASANNSASLPLARELSSNILFIEEKPNEPNYLTEMHVYFGMFLTHDITLSTVDPNIANLYNCNLENNECSVDKLYVGHFEKYIKDEECLLLGVHAGRFCEKDGDNGKSCGCPLCKKEEFQQLNFFTSFIDLSNIYSINETTLKKMREPRSAKMRLTEEKLIPLAPPNDDAFSSARLCIQSRDQKETGPCLRSPDREGNLTPFLQGLNTLFIREHNRMVDKLKWKFTDPDILFEEVRRIMIAKMQHITYNEYLPLTLGTCMDEELQVPTDNFEYDSSLDPTTFKEFVAVAFRFGHTQAANLASLGFLKNQIPMGQLFTLTPYYTAGMDIIDKLMLGPMIDAAKISDFYYNNQTINNFRLGLDPVRSDLGAMDIQRSRQYGLQSYVNYRKFFKLEEPKSFDDLKKYMSSHYVEGLKHYFGEKELESLDLLLGGLGENRVPECPGILFGPTFQSIIEEQFYYLKFGDRFWYENLDKPWSFTPEQLSEIQRTTLSGLICLNTDLQMAREEALVATSEWVSCNELAAEADIDVDYWDEEYVDTEP